MIKIISMNRFFPTLALFFLTFATFAQMETEEVVSETYLSNQSITFEPEEVFYAGSAYENDAFARGTIFIKGRVVESNVLLRYNALRDEMEVKMDPNASDATAKVMVKDPDIYTRILNKIFVYSPKKEGIDYPGYFLVVYEGEHYMLYKKITKDFIEGTKSMNSMTRDIPNMYKEKEFYYLVNKKTGTFVLFPNSRNGKLALFGNKKKQVKAFVNNERLNINKEWALKKTVLYYDSL